MKKLEIVGGGLAGLSLGIALRRNDVPVTIREASTYPRHRVCGEFINGVTEKTLLRLGIGHLFDDALRHERTQWWMGNKRILEAKLSKPALGMSRWEMDERLRVEFVSLDGELFTNDRAERKAREGLVWTAGRRLEKESDWIGLKAHFEGVSLDGYLEMHLGEGGYVGLTPISQDGSRINVCGLFRGALGGKDPMMSVLEKCGLSELVLRLGEGKMDRKSLTGISGFQLGQQRVESDLCVLGDAERMIPPFTGNGMSMAFEAAECALEPLLKYAKDELDWEMARSAIVKTLDERFRKRVGLAMGLHGFLTNPIGRKSLATAARCGVLPFQWLHRNLC